MATTYPGCRNLIRKALQLGHIPDIASDICLASISSSTFKQYNSGLRCWWEYCNINKIDIFTASIPDVLNFLSLHFNQGVSYGTLNAYRSAIAQILGPGIAQDFRIKRFFRGVFQLRPSKPRYVNTWDPGSVLNFLRNSQNKDISLEKLSHKLSMLMALASGQRVQTLALIEIKNIVESEKGIEIRVTKKIKTSGRNAYQPLIVLPFMKNDINICVATTLQDYMKRTEGLRTNTVKTSNLLLTYKKPIHNATSQTISRWIKKTMLESGVDTNLFKPHSTRHASTSLACRKGVTFDTIRLAAGWTENSKTFAKFYNRPMKEQGTFAQAVLSS